MEGTDSSEEEEDAPVVAQMLGAFGDDPLLAAHVAHAKMLKYGSKHCEADAAKAAGLAAGAVVVAKGGGVAEAACEATLAAAVDDEKVMGLLQTRVADLQAMQRVEAQIERRAGVVEEEKACLAGMPDGKAKAQLQHKLDCDEKHLRSLQNEAAVLHEARRSAASAAGF